MPVFQAGDTGANPVEATISLRKRRLLIRNRSTLLPCRIFSGACQQPELAGANLVCVRSVRATRRSASPQFRVRVPARAPWSCGVNSQHSGLLIRQVRVQIPPAPPTIATCQSSRADARRNLPAPSDLELQRVTTCPSSEGAGLQNRYHRGCKSRRRVHFLSGL